MLVEKRFASLEVVEDLDCLLTSLPEEESVAGLLGERLEFLVSDAFVVGKTVLLRLDLVVGDVTFW
jgi:hypothetical protein